MIDISEENNSYIHVTKNSKVHVTSNHIYNISLLSDVKGAQMHIGALINDIVFKIERRL